MMFWVNSKIQRLNLFLGLGWVFIIAAVCFKSKLTYIESGKFGFLIPKKIFSLSFKAQIDNIKNQEKKQKNQL